MSGLSLSDSQRKIVFSALTVLAVTVIVAFLLLVLWLATRFLTAFANVFFPLAVAAILALILKPYHKWVRQRLRVGRGLAVAFVYLSILLPLAVLVWLFGAMIYSEVTDLIDTMPGWGEKISQATESRWPRLAEFWRQHDLGAKLGRAAEQHGAKLAGAASKIGSFAYLAGKSAVEYAVGLFGWLVLPVYLALFLMAPTDWLDETEDFFSFLKTETRKDIAYLIREFVNILVTFFRGQFLIAIAQGALFGVGFGVIGLKHGLLLGFLLGCLNIIPYLGSMLTLAVALPISLLQEGGGVATAALVVAVFCAVQLIEGYLLTPKIMGDRTGLSPLVIIVAIFFWGTALDGILGMILAIPLTAFLVIFWRLVKTRYLNQIA